MLTGADLIDDLDVLRHGGMPMLFGGVYAPSTLESFLRAFSHGHVRQLQAAARQFLAGLCGRAPVLLPSAGGVTFIDADSLLRRVYGKQKQGAGFGHAKVGGYRGCQMVCAHTHPSADPRSSGAPSRCPAPRWCPWPAGPDADTRSPSTVEALFLRRTAVQPLVHQA
jgi:hypothetical protein